MSKGTFFQRAEPVVYTILRVFVAATLMQHGVQKLFGWLPTRTGGIEHFPAPEYFVGYLETFGGLMVLVGLFTRPLAFLISGEMAYAYWFVHFKNTPVFWPIINRGELASVMCFVFLYICVRGPGPYSLDALLRRRSADFPASTAGPE